MAMKMKKYEELELRDDFMFSRIMSDPKFVKPLLETILGVKIRKIVYPQTQKTIDLSLQAKGIRQDVYYNVPYKVDTTRQRDCLKC